MSIDFKSFEAKQILNGRKVNKRVKRLYHKTIDKIFAVAGTGKMLNDKFDIKSNPVINRTVNEALVEFQEQLELIIINGVEGQWKLSIDKNIAIVSKLYEGIIYEEFKTIIIDEQYKALEAFKKIINTPEGLGLSERIWNYSAQFRNEIEQGLFVGISEGKSAAFMASEQKRYLLEPDRLFRRVRNAKGNLVLSKVAKAYKPGRGVYRSSFKNAFRMTRDVTNRSYRSADFESWNVTPFVLGIEVKLSNNHPKYDICDTLVGKYPSSYKHTGFHTQCLCYATPILASPDVFDKYQESVMNGTDNNFKFSGIIDNIPLEAKQWYSDNKNRLKKYKSIPYFLKDNMAFFK